MPTEEEEETAAVTSRDERYEESLDELRTIFRTEVKEAKPFLDFAGMLILMTVSSAAFFGALNSDAIMERKIIVCLFAGILWWKTQKHAVPAGVSISLIGFYRLMRWIGVKHPKDWETATFKSISAAFALCFYFAIAGTTASVGNELAKASKALSAAPIKKEKSATEQQPADTK